MPRKLQEVQRFMDSEELAAFCTIGSKNEPHVVPVFFTYSDGKVYVQTDRTSVKVRNLQTNSQASVAVFRGEEAVIIRGTVKFLYGEEFIQKTWDHVRKYRLVLDEQGRDSLGIPLFDPGIRCVIEVVLKRMIFW